MAKMLKQTFRVIGRSSFPLDMLRYDRCFPDTQTDVAKIELARNGNCHEHEALEITLARFVSRAKDQPTLALWNSFLWSVILSSIATRPV